MPAAAVDDPAHAEIAIVSAMPLELGAFLKRCERVRQYSGHDFVFRGGVYDGIRVVVVESGAGRKRAARAAHAVLDAHSPKWILSCGFTGGLQPAVKVGQIVVADAVLGPEGERLVLQTNMKSDPARGLHVGPLFTGDHIVRTVAGKKQLADATGAVAVDMESLAVAQVCRERQVPCLVVRAVTDDCTTDLPAEAMTLFGETGTVRMGAVVGALWRRPGSLSDLWKLREQAAKAAESLASFLDGVLIQLHKATNAETGTLPS